MKPKQAKRLKQRPEVKNNTRLKRVRAKQAEAEASKLIAQPHTHDGPIINDFPLTKEGQGSNINNQSGTGTNEQAEAEAKDREERKAFIKVMLNYYMNPHL